MSTASLVEGAVKVLVEFEAELDRVKDEAVEARKRLLKIASDEGERAKREALDKAQRMAEERVRKAREDAENEASSIVKKGDESLGKLKEQISMRSQSALEVVVKQLLGE